jgi:hypothetical protein
MRAGQREPGRARLAAAQATARAHGLVRLSNLPNWLR